MLARPQDLAAGRRLRVVHGRDGAVGVANRLARPQHDFALLQRAEKLERAERAGLFHAARQPAHVADGAKSLRTFGNFRRAIHEHRAVGTFDDRLSFVKNTWPSPKRECSTRGLVHRHFECARTANPARPVGGQDGAAGNRGRCCQLSGQIALSERPKSINRQLAGR